MNDVTIVLLSCVEDPLPECIAALDGQLGGPYRRVHIHDVAPMAVAFNEAVYHAAPARFLVTVDGDVVLHPNAVTALYEAIRELPLAYMCWGQLYEEGFGLGGAVRIWRRWPLRIFRFRDRRCVDRDLHARIRWTGMYRHQVRWSDAPEQPFGTHKPRESDFAKFSKARGDCLKWAYLGRWDLIDKMAEDEYLDLPSHWGFVSAAQASKEEIGRSKNALRDYELYKELVEGKC